MHKDTKIGSKEREEIVKVSEKCSYKAEEDMILVMRKPVFRVFDQLRLKPTCPAAKTSLRLEILAIASRGIILSRLQTTKVLIRLCGCAG